MKIVGEAQKVGIELNVADIFRHPTLIDNTDHTNLGERVVEALDEKVIIEPNLHFTLLLEIDAFDADISSAEIEEILPFSSFSELWLGHALKYQTQFYDYIYADLCLTDMENIVTTNLPLAFVLLRNKTEGIRFVMRLTHCQYDGSSLPMILDSFVAGYSGEPFSQPPSYARPQSMEYWKNLLQGSSLTKLPTTELAGPFLGTRVNKDILKPQFPQRITLASILSFAWTLLLWRITGKQDIVYGHVAACRNSAFEGLQSDQTSSNLLLSVQDQFLTLGEVEYLGFREIMEHCTDWPTDMDFDSVVQHQNIDVSPEFPFGDVKREVNMFDDPDWVFPYLWVLTRPLGDHVHIRTMTPNMTEETAGALLEAYVEIIERLSASLDSSVMRSMSDIKVEI
ncbi:Nonribosomal peptide synthetase dtxS1 [Cladobotryum mycophilum]|uniref:Nonribosomal peptide synthetase dtxS1 n=1 Tax=Cladobotryum mycophilum TaxID=491253 RepID=A0ABR0SIF7_9HYPO